jgi:hypothetical protein
MNDPRWGDEKVDDLDRVVLVRREGGALAFNPSLEQVILRVNTGTSLDEWHRVAPEGCAILRGSSIKVGGTEITGFHVLAVDGACVSREMPSEDHPLRSKIQDLLSKCRIGGCEIEYVLQSQDGDVLDTNMELP